MAYSLYTAVYPITLKNKIVTISNRWTGLPATILDGPSGGVITTKGVAQLDDNATLNVYIDTAQEWVVNVMDGTVLPYNILDPKQFVSAHELTSLVPEAGKTYVLDVPPYTEYTWDGVNLVPKLTAEQTKLVQYMEDPVLTGITMSGGKLTSYTKNGVLHTVSYPDEFTVVISNSTGAVKTITLDGSGAVTDII